MPAYFFRILSKVFSFELSSGPSRETGASGGTDVEVWVEAVEFATEGAGE